MKISKLIEILNAHGGDGDGEVFATFTDEHSELCRFPVGSVKILIDSEGSTVDISMEEGEMDA